MKYLRSKHNRILLSLLSLLTAWNTSQAMVLCVGNDGHVAVEPLGHVHCGETDVDDCHCCPCTDIPIPASVAQDRPAAPAEPQPDEPAALLPSQAIPPLAVAWTPLSTSLTASTPAALLRTIVLQV